MSDIKPGKLSQFRPASKNANRHTPRGLKLLGDAMSEVGYVAPITVAADGETLDGSARLETAFEKFGDQAIVIHHDGTKPLVMVRDDIPNADTPEAKKIAYGANRIAQIDLDWEPLQLAADLEAGLDLTGLFDASEISAILEAAGTGLLNGKGKANPVPEIDRAKELAAEYGTKLGQVWQMKGHRLVIGDCTDKLVVDAVIKGETAEMMVTDPPYGVDYDPLFRERALGAADRRAQQVINDDVLSWKMAFELFPGDIAYVWHGDKQAVTSGLDLQAVDFEIVATIIWRKPHSPFGQGHYNYQHEPCWYAVRKGKNHQWAGGKDTTVWDIALDETAEGGHGTQKPLECMARPIRNHTARIIYDPFLGSGTTLIAAHNLGRRCFGCEIDPGFAAVSIKRWEVLTGEKAVLLG